MADCELSRILSLKNRLNALETQTNLLLVCMLNQIGKNRGGMEKKLKLSQMEKRK